MCSSDYTMAAAFEGPRDALAYYRHMAIPRLLAITTDRPEDGPHDPAEGYLAALDEELRPDVVALLAALDKALAAETIADSDLQSVFDSFNGTFAQPQMESEVPAYGSIADMVGADTYAGDIEQETDETDPDSLGPLLSSGQFDPSDPRHFALAVDFLDSHQRL